MIHALLLQGLRRLERSLTFRSREAGKHFRIAASRLLCPPTRRALQVMTPFQLAYALNISRRHGYVYVENPKTGCSSLKYACLSLEQLDQCTRADFENHEKLHDPSLSPLKPLIGDPEFRPISSLIARNFTFVTFVRNPYTRLVSCYRDKIEHAEKPNRYTRNLFGEGAGPFTFSEFIRVIVRMRDIDMDPHWKPQTAQTLYDIVPFRFIGRFENFTDDYVRLFSVLGIPAHQVPPLRHLNRSSQIAPSCKSYFDEELKELVWARYQQDFVNFDYSQELPD